MSDEFDAWTVDDWADGDKSSKYFSVVGDALRELHLAASALDHPVLVKAAYKCLAFELHPDRGGGEESMKRLNEAFSVLTRALAA